VHSLRELRRIASVLERDFVDARVERWVEPDAHHVAVQLYRRREDGPAKRQLEWIVERELACVGEIERLPTAPDNPPAFVGYLRRHLSRARVTRATVPGDDRELWLEFEASEGRFTLLFSVFGHRSNLYALDGYKVLVDFAHNPEAMQALFAMAQAIPARRRALCFGQAGDRTDLQIRELARSAWSIGPDLVCIAELAAYRRGRAEGEVFRIMRDELCGCGAGEGQIRHFDTESESFDAALDWAGEGDVVVMLDLGRNSDIHAKLAARQRD